MSFPSFVGLMLPYTMIAALCLFLFGLTIPKRSITQLSLGDTKKMSQNLLLLYGIDFILSLLSDLKLLELRIL